VVVVAEVREEDEPESLGFARALAAFGIGVGLAGFAWQQLATLWSSRKISRRLRAMEFEHELYAKAA
jgi:hypothetical protein